MPPRQSCTDFLFLQSGTGSCQEKLETIIIKPPDKNIKICNMLDLIYKKSPFLTE
jgi:hypothetical protein